LSHIPNKVTAGALLRKLSKANLVRLLKKSRGRSPAVYVLPELVDIAEGKEGGDFMQRKSATNLFA